MKNKIRFIMPRLIGATVIVGIAALVVTTLFKLLLGLSLLAGAVTLVVRSISKQRNRLLQYGQGEMPGFGDRAAFSHGSVGINSIQPVAGFASQKETTIVPID